MSRTLLVALVTLAVACSGGGGGDRPDGSTSAPATPKTPVDLATTGVVIGRILHDGESSEAKKVRMESSCSALHSTAITERRVQVSADGGLRDAFVHVTGLDELGFPPPEGKVEVDQAGCLYVPRVVGVRVNQPVVFINSDPILHNVHTYAENNRSMNFSMPMKGQRIEKKFKKPEVMVATRCDVHPWMEAHLGVVDHPCFAVTGEDGTFRLENVPSGMRRIAVWHGTLGELSGEVEVQAGASVELVLRYPAR